MFLLLFENNEVMCHVMLAGALCIVPAWLDAMVLVLVLSNLLRLRVVYISNVR